MFWYALTVIVRIEPIHGYIKGTSISQEIMPTSHLIYDNNKSLMKTVNNER